MMVGSRREGSRDCTTASPAMSTELCVCSGMCELCVCVSGCVWGRGGLGVFRGRGRCEFVRRVEPK